LPQCASEQRIEESVRYYYDTLTCHPFAEQLLKIVGSAISSRDRFAPPFCTALAPAQPRNAGKDVPSIER
jgi:hypothetical protein